MPYSHATRIVVLAAESPQAPPRLSKRLGEQIMGHRRVARLREQPLTKRHRMALEQRFERRGGTASGTDQLDIALLGKRLRRVLHLSGKWPQRANRYGLQAPRPFRLERNARGAGSPAT